MKPNSLLTTFARTTIASLAALAATAAQVALPATHDAASATDAARFSRCEGILVGIRAAAPRPYAGGVGMLEIDAATAILLPNQAALEHLVAGLAAQAAAGDLVFQVLTDDAGVRQLAPAVPLLPRLLGEAACRSIGAAFLSHMRGSGEGLRLHGEARPLYRPDVRGIAYFEFAAEPGGYLIVATGPHDHPIPEWSHVGSRPTQALIDRAGPASAAIARIHRPSGASLVAEDAEGNVLVQFGALPEHSPGLRAQPSGSLGSWPGFKAASAAHFAARAAAEAEERAAAWRAMDQMQLPFSPQADVWGYIENWTHIVRYSNGAVNHAASQTASTSAQRVYGQYRGPWGCHSGCVATAWATLIGWADVRAHENAPRWRGLTGLFRSGGWSVGDPAFVAPRSMDLSSYHPLTEPVQNLVDYLRYLLGTSCSGDQGSTPTSNTLYVQPYLRAQGASAGGYFDRLHRHYNTHRDWGIAAIQAGQPTLIGRDGHMAVAYGYKASPLYRDGVEIDRPVEYFWVNNGWPGNAANFKWQPAGCYAAATLTPGDLLSEWVERCRCECTVSFLGSDGRWYSVPRGGAPVRIPARDGMTFWSCGGSTNVTYFSGSATKLEIWRPDTFPTGVIFVQALR